MGKMQLKLKNWPFEKGKKVQLIWIGEPFKENNKWMIDTYFCDGTVTKKVIQDWGNLHFLSIDKYYTDGDLNSGEIIDINGLTKIVDIDLSNIIPKYNESSWNIKKSNYKSRSKTFNFYKNNILYSIPIIEIIRSVLAPNSFMLNTILYADTYEDYFTYNISERVLDLYFNNNYKKAYLKESYYNQLAWIISNKDVFKMINSIEYNMSFNNKMIYDFKMESFKFLARVRKNKIGYTILEIIKVKNKNISFNELRIHHPSFEKQEKIDKTKIRTFIKMNSDNDRIIDNEVDGSSEKNENITEELITHEYIFNPVITKEKEKNTNRRNSEDKNTKKYILNDDNRRTMASEGGEDTVTGLEVSNIDYKEIESKEIQEFLKIIELLKKEKGINRIDIILGELKEGKRGKAFAKLSDGITKRRYIIAKILLNNRKEVSVIEIEREEKSLSTLILLSNNVIEWKNIYNILLSGVVNLSGVWGAELIKYIEKIGVSVRKSKHLKKNNTYRKEKNIYYKIIS